MSSRQPDIQPKKSTIMREFLKLIGRLEPQLGIEMGKERPPILFKSHH
jgi:hypothetical protein